MQVHLTSPLIRVVEFLVRVAIVHHGGLRSWAARVPGPRDCDRSPLPIAGCWPVPRHSRILILPLPQVSTWGLNHTFAMRTAILLFSLATIFGATSCSTPYYALLEQFGVEKRDILVDLSLIHI